MSLLLKHLPQILAPVALWEQLGAHWGHRWCLDSGGNNLEMLLKTKAKDFNITICKYFCLNLQIYPCNFSSQSQKSQTLLSNSHSLRKHLNISIIN